MQLQFLESFGSGCALLDESDCLVNSARGRRDAIPLNWKRCPLLGICRVVNAVDTTIDDENLSAISIFGGDGETFIDLLNILLPRCAWKKNRIVAFGCLRFCKGAAPKMPFRHSFEFSLWPLQPHEGSFFFI